MFVEKKSINYDYFGGLMYCVVFNHNILNWCILTESFFVHNYYVWGEAEKLCADHMKTYIRCVSGVLQDSKGTSLIIKLCHLRSTSNQNTICGIICTSWSW